MNVLRTERLVLREFTPADSAFVVALLNQPSFLQHIGDRKVRTEADAVRYLAEGPIASYQRHGHGLWLVALEGQPIGMCGLLKRDQVKDVDVGYAFLPEFWSKGYAREAVAATLDFARRKGLLRVAAFVSPGNDASVKLLEKLGFAAEGRTRLTPEAGEVLVYALGL